MTPGPAIRIALVMVATHLLAVAAAAEDAQLDGWLDHQVAIRTWSASVTQTRQLRSLVQPLTSSGTVVFARPKNFRWQLGDPPRTVAVGSATELLIAYPRLRQLERYRHGETPDPALQQVIDLLEVGFPSDAAAFHERYTLLGSGDHEDGRYFLLEPRNADARRLLQNIRLEIDAEGDLLASEFTFPDGSTIRNDFAELTIDGPVDDELFELQAGPDWQVSEPLGR